MIISPDSIVYWAWGPFVLNATIVFTWIVMAVLVLVSWLVTRRLSIEPGISRWQGFLESVVAYIRDQVAEIIDDEAAPYLPFIGSIFLFVALSNFLTFVPGYQPPTGSLYTTGALALCVFFAVPVFGISRIGLKAYLRHYIQPSVFMLPFQIIGEFSRTLAMAVRLFGNIMSGTLIVAILLTIAPLFVPVIMQALGLLIGFIQAYIFAVLAAVYIASATRTHRQTEERLNSEQQQGD